MALTPPYNQKNYLGEWTNVSSDDAEVLAFIQANAWDSDGDGTGDPRVGMWYYDTTHSSFRGYNGGWKTFSQGSVSLQDAYDSDGTILTDGASIVFQMGANSDAFEVYSSDGGADYLKLTRSGADAMSLALQATTIALESSSTTDIQATGNVTIDSSGGTIRIGGDADTGNIYIGTAGTGRSVSVGNSAQDGLYCAFIGGEFLFGANGSVVEATAGNNTLRTVTSGSIVLDSVGLVDINAGSPGVDVDSSGDITMNTANATEANSASVTITTGNTTTSGNSGGIIFTIGTAADSPGSYAMFLGDSYGGGASTFSVYEAAGVDSPIMHITSNGIIALGNENNTVWNPEGGQYGVAFVGNVVEDSDGVVLAMAGGDGSGITGNVGYAGGVLAYRAGTGASITASESTDTGGVGGTLYQTGGTGGASVDGTAGAGGDWMTQAGEGGESTGSGIGGAGGSVGLLGGPGGDGTTGGAGGDVTLYCGEAGSGGSPAEGTIYLKDPSGGICLSANRSGVAIAKPFTFTGSTFDLDPTGAFTLDLDSGFDATITLNADKDDKFIITDGGSDNLFEVRGASYGNTGHIVINPYTPIAAGMGFEVRGDIDDTDDWVIMQIEPNRTDKLSAGKLAGLQSIQLIGYAGDEATSILYCVAYGTDDVGSSTKYAQFFTGNFDQHVITDTDVAYLVYGDGGITLDGNDASLQLETSGSVVIDAADVRGPDNSGIIVGHAGGQADEGSALQVVSMTTTERGYLTGVANGTIIYNSTTGKLEGYESGWGTLGVATPSGSDHQVQFNNGGAFGASANFVYDDGNDDFVLGAGTNFGLGMTPAQVIDITRSQNGVSQIKILNATAGNAAASVVHTATSTTGMHVGTSHTNHTIYAGDGFINVYSDRGLATFTNNTRRFRITNDGKIRTGATTTTPDVDPGGITLDHGAEDGRVLTCKNSDVAHGITSEDETDTYLSIMKSAATTGGAFLRGYATSTGAVGVHLRGAVKNGQADSTTATNSGGVIWLTSTQADSVDPTIFGDLGSTDNLLALRNNYTTKLILKGDGTIYGYNKISLGSNAFEDAPDCDAGGMTLNHGANDGKVVTIKNSDVGHSMTSIAQTDTYGFVSKVGAADGGLDITGLTEQKVGVRLNADVTVQVSDMTDANVPVVVNGARWDAGTGIAAMSAESNLFAVQNNGSNRLVVMGGGGIFAYSKMSIGASAFETAPDCDDGGLTLNQGANDAKILTVKSSDVAHGITDLAETDTYGFVSKVGAADGGVNISGLTEQYTGVFLNSYVTSQYSDRTSTNVAAKVNSAVKSGTTVAAMEAESNLFAIQNNGNNRVVVSGDGTQYNYNTNAAALTRNFAGVFEVQDITGSQGVTTTESGKLLTNSGAGGTVIETLPTAAIGLSYRFYVATAQLHQIKAQAGETIRVAASVSASGGTADSSTIGDAIHLVATAAGTWVAVSYVGTWNVT